MGTIRERLLGWWNNDSLQIYLSHILSSWGDRMWSFSIGIYLVLLYPESLQLTAIYGFTVCISVIIFAPLIGKWIDKSRRIAAAQCALMVQNASVIICCGILIAILHQSEQLKSQSALKGIGIGFVILCAVIASLASEATKIALEKDWIVVLAGGNEEKLSNMNATMRSIDLTTYILAPVIVGQIITYISQISGAGFIAVWNIVSGIIEYLLLRVIFNRVPQLSYKNIPAIIVDSPGKESIPLSTITDASNANIQTTLLVTGENAPDSGIKTPRGEHDISFEHLSEINLITPNPSNNNLLLVPGSSRPSKSKGKKSPKKVHPNNINRRAGISKPSTIEKVWRNCRKKVRDTWDGWRDYFHHPVRFAGIGLAMLYMTVLGFDAVTIGFAYSQGLSESFVSILTAIGAVFGILGSITFPYLRNKLGKYMTGNIGFGLETLCLVLCIASVFLSGSPFVHMNAFRSTGNVPQPDQNFTTVSTTPGSGADHSTISMGEMFKESKVSVLFLMSGIILARFGLWLADLTVVQFFQEGIPEHQRGILNGVQGALNQFMNLLKYLLVMIFPRPDTFGYLIFLSWAFVFMGWISFMIFTFVDHRLKKNKIENSGQDQEMQKY